MTGYTGKRRGRPPKAAPTPSEPHRTEPERTVRAAQFDVWMYRAEGPRLFKAGDLIPDGYVDSPAKVDPWR